MGISLDRIPKLRKIRIQNKMKSTTQIVQIALKGETLKAPKGHFVCTVCLKTKSQADKATQGNVCKTCRSAYKRAEYAANKVPMECSKCHRITTNFTGVNKICRDCKNIWRKQQKKKFKQNLGEKLLILWKAGYSYEEALKNIRSINSYK